MHQPLSAGRAFGRRTFQAVCVVILPALAGCRTPGPVPAAPTQVDRLIAVYPELSGGRFSVIADFEDPRHAQLLSWSGVSPGGNFTVDPRVGLRETGGTGVRLTISSPRDVLSINNDHATDWYMRRDWRGFDLLLAAVNAPAKTSMRVEVTAGSGQDRRTSQTVVPLDRGWNQVRLDLADLAERVPIDDVRDLRLGIADGASPAELVIDDLILTASTEELFTDASGVAHGLYARRVGRRLVIGAADRFELVFAGGQIVGWYALPSDPQRLSNLVRGTSLGPFPMAAPGAAANSGSAIGSASLWGPGGAVASRQRLIEANAVRVRVEAELDAADKSRGDGARTRTVHTIYPNGDVFIDAEWTLGPGTLAGAAVVAAGFAAVVPDGCRFRADSKPGPCAGAALVCGDGGSRFGIRWLSPTATAPTVVADVDGNGAMVAASVPVLADGVARWAAELQLVGTSRDAAAVTPPTVGAAGAPAQSPTGADDCLSRGVAIEKGTPFVASALADRQTGFDPRDGCVHVAPTNGAAKLVLDWRRRSGDDAAVAVHVPADHDTWVYVDDVLFTRAVRVSPEQLVFQVHGTPRVRTVVEVLTRQSRAADDLRGPR